MPNRKKKILFIINPISGTGRQKVVEKLIENYLDKNLFEVSIKYTQHAKHAIEISEKAVNDFDIITAVGGDGSVNEVAKALINTNTTLAIIPTGSGNGLARHLQIPINLKKAIQLLNHSKTINIDTAKINDYHFLGTAGVGFDAHIGWKFSEAPKRGFLTYIKIILREFFSYKEENYQLTIDGNKMETNAFLITFANSNQYGNNAMISPNSVIDDGFLRIIILRKFPFYSSIEFALRIFNKKFDKFKYVKEIKAKKINVLNPKTELHVDGEPLKMNNNINIEVIPKSLNVLVQ